MLVFCAVLLAHAFSPVLTSSDSRWTVMVAVSLLDRGVTNLDPYLELIQASDNYGIECGPAREAQAPPRGVCGQGHIYNLYPVGPPLLAVPLVWAMRAALQAAEPLLSRIPAAGSHPVLNAYFRGDVVGAHALVEAQVASVFIALAALLVFLIARRYLGPRGSGAIALIFAFATPAWSTASRALWQHGPSMLLITLAVYLLLGAEKHPRWAALAGVPVAFSYVVRPTNSLLVVVLSLYVLVHHRRRFAGYLLCALPVAAAFLSYNLSAFGRVFPSYYTMRPPTPRSWHEITAVFEVMAGNLISPSRGLLIFTPIVLFSVLGMVISWRSRSSEPLWRYLTGLVVLHWLTISLYVHIWWGGHSYGPRLFSDMTPILVLFLIPVFLRWRNAGGWSWRPSQCAFALLLAVSVFMHAQGGLNMRAQLWSETPVSVDQQPDRVWDWKDPQFLRGL